MCNVLLGVHVKPLCKEPSGHFMRQANPSRTERALPTAACEVLRTHGCRFPSHHPAQGWALVPEEPPPPKCAHARCIPRWRCVSGSGGWAARNGIVGLGVADGVHSWREEGIDSGLFSQGLMSAAAAAVEAGASDPLEGVLTLQKSCSPCLPSFLPSAGC